MQAIPPEKVIPGTGFTVDGFRHTSPDVQAYFLSHAHSDHYTGLTENWDKAMIYCSPVTAKLLNHLVGVKKEYIYPLAVHDIHHIQGVKVILVDANHCPGAVQFLFELPNGEKYIHCGDMRFGKHLLQDANLAAFQGAQAVFLDTTYCNPKYTFPPQEQAVEYVADTVGKLIEEQKQQNIKRIYVISTYVIGKERLLLAVQRKTGCKIGVTQQKMDTLKCLELPGVELDEVFTTDMASTPVHVVKWGFLGESWPFFRPNFVNMEEYRTERDADEVVGFLPTGWMYEMKRKSFPVREKGHCFIHLVPYSEHSSYSELREYVQFLHPHKVVPTVGVHDDASGKKSSGLQKHFRHLVNETASKHRFLRSLHRSSGSGTLQPSTSNALQEEDADANLSTAPGQSAQVAARTRSRKAAGMHSASAWGQTPSRKVQNDKLQTEGAVTCGGKRLKVEAEEEQKDFSAGRKAAKRQQTNAYLGSKRASVASEEKATEDKEGSTDEDALPHLPESLGDALGDANGDADRASLKCENAPEVGDPLQDEPEDADQDTGTLQADPDALLHDSMQPSGDATAQNPAPDNKAPTTSLKVPTSEPASTPPAIPTSDPTLQPALDSINSQTVNELLNIVAGGLDPAAAAKLVNKASGNLAAAVNLFYDSGTASVDEGTVQQPTSSVEDAPASASASDMSAGFSAASCKGSLGNISVSKPSKQASQPPAAGKQKSKGSKRAAPNADAGQAKGTVKKAKAAPQTGQRSIATFFGGQAANKQAQVKGSDQGAVQTTDHDVQDLTLVDDDVTVKTEETGDKDFTMTADPETKLSSTVKQEATSETAMEVDSMVKCEPDTVSSGFKTEDGAVITAELQVKQEPDAVARRAVKQESESDAVAHIPVKQESDADAAMDSLIKQEAAQAGRVGEVREQPSGKPVLSQPVHPFFGARRSKPTSKAPDPPRSPLPALASEPTPTHQPLPGAPEQKADPSCVAPSKTTSKPSFINPFQKPTLTAAEENVPADAVLLSIAEYDPVGMALWEAGQATPYRHISRAFQSMESTTKRLRIGDAIANMFRSILALSPEDMLHAAYLTIGKLAPDYENVELSVGGSTVAAAVVEATGISRGRLRDMYTELGDMGDVAQACRHTQTMLHKPAPLTVPGVYKTLRQIAVEKGPGSASRRQQAVLGMLRSCREHETKFLVRTLVSNMRVGANWRSVIGAMARAVVLHREGPRVGKARLDAAATAASEAYHVCPNLDILVPALVEGGIDELEKRCALTPGVPLKPMLAKISEGIPDAIKQLKGAPFLAEYKYDGTRAQIHLLPDNTVKIFSRNCEDKTVSMPDVVSAIQAAAEDRGNKMLSLTKFCYITVPALNKEVTAHASAGGSTSLVIDAELVAVERGDNNRLKAFQELSTRARGQIAADQVTMHVCVFVFDLLYVDGDSLVHLPLRQRRARLAQALPNLEPGFVQFATSMEFQPAALAAAAAAAAPDAATAAEAAAAVTAAGGAKVHPQGPSQDLHCPPQAAGLKQDHKLPPSSDSKSGNTQDSKPEVQQESASLQSVLNQGQQLHPALHNSKPDSNQDVELKPHQQSDAALPGTTDTVACLPGDAGLHVDATAAAAEATPDTNGGQAVVSVSEVAVQSIEERIQEFLLESFAGGTEGLMLKALDVAAGYQPSKRSDSWIKLKRDYCEGLRDSLDLVVIGAWYGQGRKTKWYSPFLLAAYNPETEELQSVCRCMSGYTDAFYAEATARLQETIVPTKKPYIITDESPNVWFEPKEVWEIRGADLTISPVHKAAVGLIHPDRGISLRFPRFITIRDDKKPEDASSSEVVADLYNKQSRRMASAAEMLASKSKGGSAVPRAEVVANANDDNVDGEAMED